MRSLMSTALCAFVAFILVVNAKLLYTCWPQCGPTFKVSEQLFQGRVVYWLRRRDVTPWPICGYALDSPSMFADLESAKAAAADRLARKTGEERVVATVP